MPKKIKIFLTAAIIITTIATYEAIYLFFNQKQNQELKKQIYEIAGEKEVMRGQLKEMAEVIVSLKQEVVETKKTLEEKERQRKEIENQTAQAQADAQSLRQEVAEAKKALNNRVDREEELKKQTAKAQADAQRFRDLLKDAKIKIKELDKELKLVNGKNVSLERLNSKIENTLQDTKDKLTQTQDDLISLKQKLSRINSEDIDPLRKEISRLNESLLNKDKEFAAQEGQIQDLNEKYATLNNTNNFLEKQIVQLETDRSSLQSQVEKANAQLTQQDTLIVSLKHDLNSVTDLFTRRALEVDKRQKEIVTLKDEISGLKSRLSDLERHLATTKERYGRVIKDFGELTRLNDNLQDRLNKLSEFLEPEDSDRKKAGELRRKIEVILDSIEPVTKTTQTEDAQY